MDNFDQSYSETEYDDCLISLITLHNLEIGKPSEIWDNLVASFNAVTGENYSIEEIKSRIVSLQTNRKHMKNSISILNKTSKNNSDFQVQKLKAEKAREKAEFMTFKAEQAKKKRIELEVKVLETQLERENILKEVAELSKKAQKSK